LYNKEMLVDYSTFQLFEKETKGTGIKIVFSEFSSQAYMVHRLFHLG